MVSRVITPRRKACKIIQKGVNKVTNWKKIEIQDLDEANKLYGGRKAISFGALLCRELSVEMQVPTASSFKIVEHLQKAQLIDIGGRSSVLGAIKENSCPASSLKKNAKLMIQLEWHKNKILISNMDYYNAKGIKHDVFKMANKSDNLVVSYKRTQRFESSFEALLYSYLLHKMKISMHSIASVTNEAQGKSLLSNYAFRQRNNLLNNMLKNRYIKSDILSYKWHNHLLFKESLNGKWRFWLVHYKNKQLLNVARFNTEQYTDNIGHKNKNYFSRFMKLYPEVECFAEVLPAQHWSLRFTSNFEYLRAFEERQIKRGS